ncbi:hypothetical protein M2161_006879 [Streptomyces sp. SAI-133]|nr:hypothetical protein [Streptomyces sp. SAI-133]
MGSSAWNSEFRASFAVPRAESPSTMNSSLRSTSSLRQSASLAGSEDDSRAVLRRCASLCWRAAIRVRAAATAFLHDDPGLGRRVPLRGRQERLELLGDHGVHDAAGRRGAEDLLGLALELRLGEAHGDDRGQALESVVLDDVVLGDTQQLLGAQHLVHRLGDGLLEAGDMGAALGRGDDVDERLEGRVVTGPPAHRDVHAEFAGDLGGRHLAVVVEDRDGLLEGALAGEAEDVVDRLVGGQVLAELADAAVEAERLLALAAALPQAVFVTDDDGQAGYQERGLAGALVEVLQGELGVLQEDLPVGPVPHARAGPGLGDPLGLAQAAGGFELGVGAVACEGTRHAAPEADRMGAAGSVHLDVQPRGQGVHHGGAHAVQAAGGGVRATAELAAGVQLGHDDLDAGQARLGFDVDRDAPAVVTDLHGGVVVEDHLDVVAVPPQGLVDGVVDDLPQTVHQATAVGRSDVHARALAYGLEPLEDEQVPRGVVGTVPVCSCQQSCGRHGRLGGHAVRSSLNFRWGPCG